MPYKNSSEEWKPVAMEPYSSQYEVSSIGRVRRKYIGRERIGGYRYLTVKVYGKIRKYPYIDLFINKQRKKFNIHLLVAEAFIGPRLEGFVINHKDGNKNNNDYQNLEYVTQSQNLKHAFATGLKNCNTIKGTKNWRGKLTNEQVLEIKELKKTYGISNKDLAERYNVTASFICNIVKGRRRNESAL